MLEISYMAERILIFGDTSGMTEKDISSFVTIAHCSNGGRFDGPIEERAKQILKTLAQHREQKDNGQYVVIVIDSDPLALAKATKTVAANGDSLQADILQYITMIQLGTQQGSDRVDQATGLRIAHLPRPLFAYPTHPTPAS